MAAPRKGRRPGHVSYAPWRGFPERPWFDAPFLLGPAMTRSANAKSRPSPALPPLPISAEMWNHVVKRLRLSPRLASTAELLLRGMQGKEIAARLGIAHSTMRTYLNRIYQRAESLGAGGCGHTHFILLVFSIVVRMENERTERR